MAYGACVCVSVCLCVCVSVCLCMSVCVCVYELWQVQAWAWAELLKGREERQKDRPRQVGVYRASLPHTYHACNKSAKTEGPEGGIEIKGLGFSESTCTQQFTQYAEVHLKRQSLFTRKYTHICAHYEHACIHMHNAHARNRYLCTPPFMQPHIQKQ
jgi:hypothetical protein